MASSEIQKLILVVDDDRSVTASLSLLLKHNKYHVLQAHDPEIALSLIEKHSIDLVLQDMNFSRATTGEEGMALLENIQSLSTDLPVILMTAWGSISLAVEGMRAGASDFFAKPWNNEQLLRTIATNLETNAERSRLEDNSYLSRKELDATCDFSAVVGESPAILKTLSTIARVCKTNASVLILGESGTGKEVFADAIHRNSLRQNASMIKVNLGGITTSLFESEMFGHVKGAFTDAKQDRLGRFSTADGGTLFLDEIGELDKSSQVKLLRVLQDQSFQMVGSSKNTTVDVRIISATNQNLEELVAQDRFREDLFYRINLIMIQLPPLRERVQDIPLLAEYHLRKVSLLYGIEQASISDSAIDWLKRQMWPGNIRQLCQTVERALLMSGNSELDIGDFISNDSRAQQGTDKNLSLDNVTLDEMEKIMIEKALTAYQGNISKVAEALGLSRSSLYRRLEKHEINH